MTDIRTALTLEIRNRADAQRRHADSLAKCAHETADLAEVLDMVAQKLERGEADDKVSELLEAARPSLTGPLLGYGQKEETEEARLRRVFGLDS
jgi:hypothetical protein